MITVEAIEFEALVDGDAVARAIEQILRNHGRAQARFDPNGDSRRQDQERRRARRQTMEIPFYLYPAMRFGEWMQLVSREPVMALSRDLSRNGIGFQYDAPIEGRYVVAEFDSMQAEPYRFVVVVRWRQKRTKHLYTAGGRIVGLVAPANGAG